MNEHDDDDDQTPEDVLKSAIGELLNLAASVAELQTTDEAADDIYAICDFVAEYYQIERVHAVVTENDDGSITTRFESIVGAGVDEEEETNAKTRTRQGSIRTHNMPKLRLIDLDSPFNIKKRRDLDDDDDV
jgi:hypothetical protein